MVHCGRTSKQARVVDQDIDAAEAADGLLNQLLVRAWVGEIRTDAKRSTPLALDLLHSGGRRIVLVVAHHVGSGGGQRHGDGGPDASRGGRYKRDFPVDTKRIVRQEP